MGGGDVSVDPSAEFDSGKPKSRLDDPGPVRHGVTSAHRKAARDAKVAAAVRAEKLEAAASAAARDLSVAHVGVVRSSLFDVAEWRKEHAARQGRMESTFSKLYQPQASSYWMQKKKPLPRKPPAGKLPSYTQALPEALSLSHPSTREPPSEDEDEEAEVVSLQPHPAAAFDPLAEPQRFYSSFKERVATLRGEVRAPDDRTAASSALPRAADAVVAAATAPSPPPDAPSAVEPNAHELVEARPSWALSALSAPLLDVDFDVEPSLVYTDSAHYLADHGVQIPMWDEV